MIKHLTACFAGSPAKKPTLRTLLILLLAAAMPLWAAEPKELDWPALIPEGAPVIPPQLTPCTTCRN